MNRNLLPILAAGSEMSSQNVLNIYPSFTATFNFKQYLICLSQQKQHSKLRPIVAILSGTAYIPWGWPVLVETCRDKLERFSFRATDTQTQVHYQQTALIPKYKTLLHVSATVHSHLQGVAKLKDEYSVIVNLPTDLYNLK